jgi:hypothetical protein
MSSLALYNPPLTLLFLHFHLYPTFVHTMQTRSKSKTLTNPPQAFLSSSYPLNNIDLEPNTFIQAVKHEH